MGAPEEECFSSAGTQLARSVFPFGEEEGDISRKRRIQIQLQERSKKKKKESTGGVDRLAC